MFVETVTSDRDEWDRWNERLGMLNDPPAALVCAIAWSSSDGKVMSVNVWDSPEAVADFFVERVLPLVEREGEPPSKPDRHGAPLAFYVRPPTSA